MSHHENHPRRNRPKSLNQTPTHPLRSSLESSPFKSLQDALNSISYNSNSYFIHHSFVKSFRETLTKLEGQEKVLARGDATDRKLRPDKTREYKL